MYFVKAECESTELTFSLSVVNVKSTIYAILLHFIMFVSCSHSFSLDNIGSHIGLWNHSIFEDTETFEPFNLD